MDFQEWLTTEWVNHKEESGGIKARLSMLTAAVGAMFASTVMLIGTIITVLWGG